MSSGIDNSGTGEASGKKSKLKKSKFSQILTHGSPGEQESTSVLHVNQQETTTSRISLIRAEHTSIKKTDKTAKNGKRRQVLGL